MMNEFVIGACKACRKMGLLSLYGRQFSNHRRRLSGRLIYSRADKSVTLCQSSCVYSTKAAADSQVNDSGLGQSKKQKIVNGPDLSHFIRSSFEGDQQVAALEQESVPYLSRDHFSGHQRRVYMDVHGCQMNVNDTEVAWAILEENGFQKATDVNDSDVVLIMTCSIREGAEQKIWRKLQRLRSLKNQRARNKTLPPMKIGVLGCMAERLKKEILEKEQAVDLICGPDAYRDLPKMLALTESGQAAVNVLLSLDETYADIMPVRLNQDSPSAFVSIMRGCDNMCTYCIVPFTRGRERSRPISSIVDEIRALSDKGIKEVTLLGQNVNSYRDTSEIAHPGIPATPLTNMSKGFKTVYKPKKGGLRFADLLDKVSEVDPDMRVRFTSPHPKDFPDEVLYLIRERPNICNQIHLPAQSGSSRVLESMRRGYTREAYIDLVHHIKDIIPDISLSSDFIAGFCGESDEDHKLTVDLMRQMKYNFAFCFPYSMRKKTAAFHRLQDDVPEAVKSVRHMELIDVFREEAVKLNKAAIGTYQLVLIEGDSKRSDKDFAGRNDANTKVILPKCELPHLDDSAALSLPKPGEYVVTQITDGSSQVLKGKALHFSNIQAFYEKYFSSTLST